MARHAPMMLCALGAASAAPTRLAQPTLEHSVSLPGSNTAVREQTALGDSLAMAAINGLISTVLNPLLDNNVPDSYHVPGLDDSGSTGSSCIIKAPWGNKCFCSVEARYYADADTISDIHAALTPSVTVNGDNFTIPFTGSAILKGTAGAGASACGLNLEPSGSLTEALKISGTVKATIDVGLCGIFNPTPKLNLKALEVDDLTIIPDNPQLDLDLSGAGVFDGALAGISNLLSSMIPKIVNALLPPINAGLSKNLASINNLLPSC